jgi:hypothetical protein
MLVVITHKEFSVKDVSYLLDVQYLKEKDYVRIEASVDGSGFIIEYISKKSKQELTSIFNNLYNSIRGGLVTSGNLQNNIEVMFSADKRVERAGGVQTMEIPSNIFPQLVFLALSHVRLAGLERELKRYDFYHGYIIEKLIYISADGGTQYFIIGRMDKDKIVIEDRFFGRLINVSTWDNTSIRELQSYLGNTNQMLGSIPPLVVAMLFNKWSTKLDPIRTIGETSEDSPVYEDNPDLVSYIRRAVSRMEKSVVTGVDSEVDNSMEEKMVK